MIISALVKDKPETNVLPIELNILGAPLVAFTNGEGSNTLTPHLSTAFGEITFRGSRAIWAQCMSEMTLRWTLDQAIDILWREFASFVRL